MIDYIVDFFNTNADIVLTAVISAESDLEAALGAEEMMYLVDGAADFQIRWEAIIEEL